MTPPQHAGLTLERWQKFSLDQQLLMIANEMSRATKSLELGETESLRASYERALRLVELTAAGSMRLTFRRELLRWRGLLAELYLDPGNGEQHTLALASLLLFSPVTASQRPFLLPR
jgi:hypothetical protein